MPRINFYFFARYIFLLILPASISFALRAQVKDTLTNKNNLLNQTLITAGRYEQSVKKMTVSTEIIKPYLIRGRNTTMMDKLLDNIPSVHVTDGQVNIRNGSGWTYGIGSRVMVLVDGMPFLTGDAGQVKWNFIPIENVEQVEVIKGASSVLYGSSALSGIIHFRTEMAKNKPVTRINLHAGVFSNPSRQSLGWSNAPRWQSGLTAFHSFRKKNYASALSLDYLKDMGYRMGENDHRIRLGSRNEFSKGNKKYGLNAGLLITDGGSFLLWESFEKGYTALDSATTSTFSVNYYLDPYYSWNTENTKQSLKGRWYYVNNDITNSNPSQNQDNSSNNFYGEYQAIMNLKALHMVASGGAMAQYSVSNSPLYQGFQSSRNFALFLQLEQQLTAKLSWVAGARLEHFAINGKGENKPVFRSGINYEAGKATYLRASFGQGFRFPSIAERYVQTSVGLLNIFPNPNLQPETGWNAEIGVKQGLGKKNLKGYIDLSLFVTRYQNMIDFNLGVWRPIQDPFNPFPSYGFTSINTGDAQISGFDVSTGWEWHFSKTKMNLLAGYTYSMPISLEPDKVYAIDSLGNPVSFRSTRSDSTNVLKYRFVHLVRIDLNISRGRWNFGLTSRYNSLMENIDAAFVSLPLNLFITGVDKGRELSAKGIWVFDARVGYQLTDKLKASLIVNNIFNNELMTRPADLRPPRLTMIQFAYVF